MKEVTVSLISNTENEIKCFLNAFYEKDMNIKNKAFKWSILCNSPFECLNLVTTAIDNSDKYHIQVFVHLPEFETFVNDKNINEFIKYIYLSN